MKFSQPTNTNVQIEIERYENVRRHGHRLYNLMNSQKSNKRSMVGTIIGETTSQIYSFMGLFQICAKFVIS